MLQLIHRRTTGQLGVVVDGMVVAVLVIVIIAHTTQEVQVVLVAVRVMFTHQIQLLVIPTDACSIVPTTLPTQVLLMVQLPLHLQQVTLKQDTLVMVMCELRL